MGRIEAVTFQGIILQQTCADGWCETSKFCSSIGQWTTKVPPSVCRDWPHLWYLSTKFQRLCMRLDWNTKLGLPSSILLCNLCLYISLHASHNRNAKNPFSRPYSKKATIQTSDTYMIRRGKARPRPTTTHLSPRAVLRGQAGGVGSTREWDHRQRQPLTRHNTRLNSSVGGLLPHEVCQPLRLPSKDFIRTVQL